MVVMLSNIKATPSIRYFPFGDSMKVFADINENVTKAMHTQNKRPCSTL